MRGGKREGSGRKGNGLTKVYRLPVDIEPQIIELVKKYKSRRFDSVTKSKSLDKPIPLCNKEQLQRLRYWLKFNGYAASPTEARKMTDTAKKTQDVVLKLFDFETRLNWAIRDIRDLYK